MKLVWQVATTGKPSGSMSLRVALNKVFNMNLRHAISWWVADALYEGRWVKTWKGFTTNAQGQRITEDRVTTYNLFADSARGGCPHSRVDCYGYEKGVRGAICSI